MRTDHDSDPSLQKQSAHVLDLQYIYSAETCTHTRHLTTRLSSFLPADVPAAPTGLVVVGTDLGFLYGEDFICNVNIKGRTRAAGGEPAVGSSSPHR